MATTPPISVGTPPVYPTAFVSSPLTIPTTTLGTPVQSVIPHGLGVVPTWIRPVFVVYEAGNTLFPNVGTEIDWQGWWNATYVTWYRVQADATNIYLILPHWFTMADIGLTDADGNNFNAYHLKVKVYAGVARAATPGGGSGNMIVKFPDGNFDFIAAGFGVDGDSLTVGSTTYNAGSVLAAVQLLDQIEQALAAGKSYVALQSMNDASVGSVSGASGYFTGGTIVTITGDGFRPGGQVSFGGVPCSVVEFVSETTLVVQTPPCPAGGGYVDVTYSDDRGSAGLEGGFLYTSPPTPHATGSPPSIGSVTPNTATYAPSTTYTFTVAGTLFAAGCLVQLFDGNGVFVTGVATVVSPTSITLFFDAAAILAGGVPPNGPTDIRYTGPDGVTCTLAGAITWS